MSTNSKIRRYPLSWPDGWPRTAAGERTQSQFRVPGRYKPSGYYDSTGKATTAWVGGRNHSMEESVQFLLLEVERLGCDRDNVIISTSVKNRQDGLPMSGQGQPTDPGAAIYFQLENRPVSLACDKWKRVEDNLWAIAKHIEAIRGQARWGVGSVSQAFRGYMALPEVTSGIRWWEVLNVPVNASEDQIRDSYRKLAKTHHPDVGGTPAEWQKVQEAFNQANAIHRDAA